jgi:hypothetical protein
MISTATQIVDSAGHIWTVKSGLVDENGTAAGTTSGVTTLLYWNGTDYQQTSAGWWSPQGTLRKSQTEPLNYDLHLSLVGHQLHDKQKAAYAVIDLVHLPVAAAKVNGIEEP